MKISVMRVTVWSVVGCAVLLAGCQQVRVDRWVEVPCQPHGFYIAPKGQTLDDVASTCQVDKRVLHKHNAWLITQQPFADNTVVWLRRNPMLGAAEDDTLQVETIDMSAQSGLSAEKLEPLGLPTRAVPAKRGVLPSSAH
jgi:hypothetical protein